MAIDMSQFYQVFFDESVEHLETLESQLLRMDVAQPQDEDLNAIFRAAHSIKGSAATFGFTDLAELTHVMENLLDRLRKREQAPNEAMVETLLACGDALRAMLAAHQGQGKVEPARIGQLLQRLNEHIDNSNKRSIPVETSSIDRQHCYAIEFVPTEMAADDGGVRRLLAEFSRQGRLTILAEPEASARDMGLWRLRLETSESCQSLSDQVDFVAEGGAWRVEEENPAVDHPGYGFFSDMPMPDIVAAGDDPGYGFFEPLPDLQPATPAGEEGDGYGFFEPLPAPPAEASPISAEAPPERGKGARALQDGSIRVSVDKVDQLLDLVGELVITQAMLLESTALMQDAAPEKLLAGLAQLERNTRHLQESVMSIRMLPISFAFSRFPRVVHDLSAKLGKEVELKMSGETTELDKGLIERIMDPLTHLVRNSLDHGIESPEVRRAAGKRPIGTITLRAYQQGGIVVVEVGDDGAGLQRQRILAKARERGMPVSEQMSDQEVFNLIFEAGFSTAAQVTDVSGRGVGMDVVRRNIQAMGGRVEIESMPGIGTRITVRLPLTLAILDGMSVQVGEHTYILPLTCVIESFQPLPGQAKTVSNRGRVVQVRGDYLPVLYLHEVFNLPRRPDDDEGIMVVVEADGLRVVLGVDALLGQHQVVIKSLENNFRRVAGISGATIMGDGRVALILDVASIAAQARGRLADDGRSE